MKKYLAYTGAFIGWFAILAQYYLMIENRTLPLGETTIRYFSFFTILTNLLVAIYFTAQVPGKQAPVRQFFTRPGILTAVTVYITVVGLVYQIVLRQIWEPTGLQMIVDELLHSVAPLLVALYWYLYEDKLATTWAQLPQWLIYPSVYLVFILIRGGLSGFYPYPFMDVLNLGYQTVLTNAAALLVLFLLLSTFYVGVGKLVAARKKPITDQ